MLQLESLKVQYEKQVDALRDELTRERKALDEEAAARQSTEQRSEEDAASSPTSPTSPTASSTTQQLLEDDPGGTKRLSSWEDDRGEAREGSESGSRDGDGYAGEWTSHFTQVLLSLFLAFYFHIQIAIKRLGRKIASYKPSSYVNTLVNIEKQTCKL